MAKSTTQSIEPLIADLANSWLKAYKLDYKLEQESLNTEIDTALKGLLEAVGKVEIVDEDKLNASLDSEVDKP